MKNNIITKQEAISIREIDGQPTMSSLRIAEVTGKEHSKVTTDCENMFKALNIDERDFSRPYKYGSNNNKANYYLLFEREFQILISGYSISHRATLIDELMSYRKKEVSVFELPKTFSEALLLAGKLEEEKQQALDLVEKRDDTIKKKDLIIVDIADLNMKSGEVSIGDFAKNLSLPNLGQNNMFKWLKARGYLMENRKPYQSYVERGYFVVRPSEEKINGQFRYTTLLTPKGTIWLTRLIKVDYELD